jgi:hypothetical protein
VKLRIDLHDVLHVRGSRELLVKRAAVGDLIIADASRGQGAAEGLELQPNLEDVA